MSVRWSRVHAILGLSPRELTYKDVCDAVAQSAIETDDLDFKQALPPSVDAKLREFAKDVAAMANTRGGLIVFGVVEAEEHAVEVCGVPNGERDRQRLSNIAATRIQPVVSGLDIFALDGDADDPGLLIVSVPPSPDSPHLIGNEADIGIPFRYGSNTRWMRERDVERAYADRFARRVSSVNALREQKQDLIDEVELSDGCWFVASSRPLMPIPTIRENPTREDIINTLKEIPPLAYSVAADGGWKIDTLSELDHGANNPRVGLRRWITRANPFDLGGQSKEIHVELHHDGSTSFAACLQAWTTTPRESFAGLHVNLVESVIVDAIILAVVHARNVGGDTKMSIEIDLTRNIDTPPIMMVRDRKVRGLRVPGPEAVPGSRQVRRFKSVYTEISTTETIEGIRAVAWRIAEDVLNQFGVHACFITPYVRI